MDLKYQGTNADKNHFLLEVASKAFGKFSQFHPFLHLLHCTQSRSMDKTKFVKVTIRGVGPTTRTDQA